MEVRDVNLGFSVADGEGVEFHLVDGDLRLRFTDWQGQDVEHTFVDTLAVRWAASPTVETPRDDSTYEVAGSAWSDREAKADARAAAELVHYILCFNACGVLEIVCRQGASAAVEQAAED